MLVAAVPVKPALGGSGGSTTATRTVCFGSGCPVFEAPGHSERITALLFFALTRPSKGFFGPTLTERLWVGLAVASTAGMATAQAAAVRAISVPVSLPSMMPPLLWPTRDSALYS